jgi:hypothetical protein
MSRQSRRAPRDGTQAAGSRQGWANLAPMPDARQRLVIAILIAIGATLGLAGSFVPSPSLRAVLWGIDGTALVVAGAWLTIRYARQGQDLAAVGFLVFTVGEALILATSAMDLRTAAPMFGAGVGLWAASLVMIGIAPVFPVLVRALGIVAAALFAYTALAILGGQPLDSLSTPLPANAYPLLVATMVGWIVTLVRRRP